MRSVRSGMVGSLLGIGLALILGLVLARVAGATPGAEDPMPTPQATPTGTVTRVHPVALALSRWVSQTFPAYGITSTVSLTEILGLHTQGFGYGEIARALWLVLATRSDNNPTNDLTLEQALTLGHQIGWGQAYRQYGVHPGGRGLGAIMRAAKEKPTVKAISAPAGTPTAPGPRKPPPGWGRSRRP